MTITIPEYIEHRIRQPIPDDLYVVENSIPVIFFGNFERAKIATISINPSDKEFLNDSKEELVGNLKRFETLTSLQTDSLENAPASKIEAVYSSCLNYFDTDKGQPYRRWFNTLENILKILKYSYYDSSACHLDLVQWATSEKWNKLDEDIRNRLLRSDVPFLKKQLEQNINIKTILLNGRKTLETVKQTLELNLKPVNHKFICKTRGNDKKYEMFEGTYRNNIKVIGWTAYLQKLQCQNATALKEEIGNQVKQLIGTN